MIGSSDSTKSFEPRWLLDLLTEKPHAADRGDGSDTSPISAELEVRLAARCVIPPAGVQLLGLAELPSPSRSDWLRPCCADRPGSLSNRRTRPSTAGSHYVIGVTDRPDVFVARRRWPAGAMRRPHSFRVRP